MAKWTPEQRLLYLMEEIKWKGVDNWTSLKAALQQKEFLPFRQWLRKNLVFVPGERARTALEKYYLQNESLDTKAGEAVYLKEGRACLNTAYQKDMAYGRRD